MIRFVDGLESFQPRRNGESERRGDIEKRSKVMEYKEVEEKKNETTKPRPWWGEEEKKTYEKKEIHNVGKCHHTFRYKAAHALRNRE